ncbi:DsbA family protein [Sphingomonas sp. HT-1]|uniref:DsbA family protein n=1 Tax=unclassified Sphingomonas TaxID=196159 RepID=UPI0002D45419|nr:MULTISPECIES: DsbA family protein [unclassified Sphingomonas]KTF68374.1 disulfide bond formation protein DsbA [Sphingomonas sp. WG]
MARWFRHPLALIAGFLVAAILGGAVALGLQAALPGLGGNKAQVERIVRAYLLDRPEILREMMERLQQQETAQQQQAQEAAQGAIAAQMPALTTAFGSAWAGNPKGDVTVAVFMDYACGYCRASLPAVAELVAKDPNVRIVYREFPVLGNASVTAARFALAAAQQGKFRAFHDALFAADGPSDAAIADALTKAGLDRAVAEKAAASESVTREIESNHKLGAQLAMNGTPSWVVGGKILYGARDYAALAEAVAAARKAK